MNSHPPATTPFLRFDGTQLRETNEVDLLSRAYDVGKDWDESLSDVGLEVCWETIVNQLDHRLDDDVLHVNLYRGRFDYYAECFLKDEIIWRAVVAPPFLPDFVRLYTLPAYTASRIEQLLEIMLTLPHKTEEK